MRIQLVRTLQGGEKLAGPVITKENEILISEGTTLKTEYLDLISFLGIETVCIEDPYEEMCIRDRYLIVEGMTLH